MTHRTLGAAARARVYVGTWANTAARALRRGARDRDRARDRGQGSIEYLGIIILVALIIVAIVGTGIDKTIADALKSAVAKVTSAGG
ncbi:hypothetical protein JFN87_12185 [Streptomyces bomunensis]|uniref:Flp family type IVb pilin n=1 Tax=Streptomyces montanisoli TaxID=2798581 RepID=A0A940MBI7_9ACTN|nr:hypothetical protein [Streptomyces montanisoli]